MCKLFVICQYSLKPPMPSFVTTSTKHSSDLQPGLQLKSGSSPQLWWFIFTSGRCKCLIMHGGTVNNYKVGKTMVSLSPSVFITGVTHTDLKLCVSVGMQGQGKWMRNTLLRLKASGHMCLFHAWTHFSKLASAKYDKGQRRPYNKKKNILKIRYGCQHPRNCSPEPMMDKGRCAFEE